MAAQEDKRLPDLEPDPYTVKQEVKSEPFPIIPVKKYLIKKEDQVALKKKSTDTILDTVSSYFPRVSTIVKLCFIFIILYTTHGFCTKIIYPTLNLPAHLNDKLVRIGQSITNITFGLDFWNEEYWDSFSSVLRTPVPSTNVTKLKASLQEIQSLDTQSLASLSSSLHEASSVLSDIPLTTADFPNSEVKKEVEEFRTQLRDLSSQLRDSYHSTWKVFLRSKSFMERGHRFIQRLLKAAESGNHEAALTWLQKLQAEVLGLQQQHVDANEALDKAYLQVNIISSEAKRKSLHHLEISESLVKGWTREQKTILYGLGIVGGVFGGPIGAVATECVVGLYHWIDNDNSKIKASKHARVGENFSCAYQTLDQTREIINKDILILGEISQYLEDLLLDSQDVGIAIEEPEMRDDLRDLCDQTEDKFSQLQHEYERIINAPRANQMRQITEGSKDEL